MPGLITGYTENGGPDAHLCTDCRQHTRSADLRCANLAFADDRCRRIVFSNLQVETIRRLSARTWMEPFSYRAVL